MRNSECEIIRRSPSTSLRFKDHRLTQDISRHHLDDDSFPSARKHLHIGCAVIEIEAAQGLWSELRFTECCTKDKIGAELRRANDVAERIENADADLLPAPAGKPTIMCDLHGVRSCRCSSIRRCRDDRGARENNCGSG